MRMSAMTIVLSAALACAAPALAEQGSPIPPAAIDDLMVTPDEASSVMKTGFPVVDRFNALSALTTDRPDCGSVVLPSVATYDRGP